MVRYAPGPRDHWLLGCSKRFRESPLSLLEECRGRFGGVVQLPVGLGASFCLIFDPADLEKVFAGSEFGRSDLAKEFEPLAGGSMIIADGATWKAQRKAVIPSFSQARIRDLACDVDVIAKAESDRWLKDSRTLGNVDVQSSVVRYAMAVLSVFLFGQQLGDSDNKTIAYWWQESLRFMNIRLTQALPIPAWVPTTNNVRLKRAAGNIDAILLRIIRNARNFPEKGSTSFLSDLLDQVDNSGRPLSDDLILREIKGVFLAGFDTVASGMMWTVYELARNPDWQRRIREELLTSYDTQRSAVNLGGTPLLEMFFKEVTRLWPSLWLVDRKTNANVVLGGHQIPAGTNIITSPWVTHRDPELWKTPRKFDPFRFDATKADTPMKFAHFPFGGGRMKCIGIGLTYLEIRGLLYHVLSKLSLEYGGESVEIEPAFVLRPKVGLRVRAKRPTTEYSDAEVTSISNM